MFFGSTLDLYIINTVVFECVAALLQYKCHLTVFVCKVKIIQLL